MVEIGGPRGWIWEVEPVGAEEGRWERLFPGLGGCGGGNRNKVGVPRAGGAGAGVIPFQDIRVGKEQILGQVSTDLLCC